MTYRSWLAAAVVLVAASCGQNNNSTDTDHASLELRRAQGEVSGHSNALATNQGAIEQTKRQLTSDQQALADQQALLGRQRLQLGSAQGSLQDARVAYGAAVKERFAKLEASLATLATRIDATSKDAAVGLRARGAQLAQQLAAMPAADPSWADYTRDVDTAFDAIERDLSAAIR
jgi:chromosome segregation ATPase